MQKNNKSGRGQTTVSPLEIMQMDIHRENKTGMMNDEFMVKCCVTGQEIKLLSE